MTSTPGIPLSHRGHLITCICLVSTGIMAATLVEAPPHQQAASVVQHAVVLRAVDIPWPAADQPAPSHRSTPMPSAADSATSFLEQAPAVIVFAVLFLGPIFLAGVVGSIIWAATLPFVLIQDAVRWVTAKVSGTPSPTPAAANRLGVESRTAAHSARSAQAADDSEPNQAIRPIRPKVAGAQPTLRPSSVAQSSRTASQRDSEHTRASSHSLHRSTGASARPAKGVSSQE